MGNFNKCEGLSLIILLPSMQFDTILLTSPVTICVRHKHTHPLASPQSSIVSSHSTIVLDENTGLLPIFRPASTLLLTSNVATVEIDHMPCRIVCRIPSGNSRVRNLPQLKSLGATIQSHKLLTQGVVPPLRQKDCPEVVVNGANEDTAIVN
jgi:hypothetical protein